MSLISYAQNFEDVMLARALRDVSKGFYIDVGAQDPSIYSVTRAFYDSGWRGINVEPSQQWFDRLETERPHDINLKVAASDEEGSLRFFNVEQTGLSTINREFARRHAEAGFEVVEEIVPCRTLDSICADAGVETVHFLKVDCEGAELQVLRGFSLKKVRPWLVLVEATEPLTEKPNYEAWESLLTRNCYHFVYDDGLNRFYVADEKSELDGAFSRPPNVFDDFVRVAEVQMRRELEVATGAVVDRDQWRNAAEHLRAENERREAALEELRARLEEVGRQEAGEREQLHATIEHLRGENERRESALMQHRKLLADTDRREVDERQRLQATIDFLCQENERRESALVEHRRLLDDAGRRETKEREQLQATIDYLRQENERRESALVEHRQLVDDAERRKAGEVEQLQATIEYLHQENERREAALKEHRQLLEDAARRELSERAQLQTTIEYLRQENERREAALVGHRSARDAARSDLEDLGRRLRAAEKELGVTRAALRAKALESSTYQTEVSRLMGELAARSQEIARMDAELDAILGSTSWRISAPVRATKRLAVAGGRFATRTAYQLVRWPARLMRPVLRAASKRNGLRTVTVRILGKDSSIVHHTRLFLFGNTEPVELEERPVNAQHELGWQAARVRDRIESLRRRDRRGVSGKGRG